MIGVLAGGVAGWGACLLLDSMDGCLDGCWPCQPPVSGQKGGSVAGLACSKSMDGWEAEGGGTAGTPGPRLLVPGQLYPVACQETGYRQRGCQDP